MRVELALDVERGRVVRGSDFAARAAESARAKAEFAQRAAERKASTEDKGVKRPVYTGDQNQFNANMAAIALTPGRTAVGSSLPVSQRPATTLSRAMIDQVRALLPAAQRPVGLEEMLNRAENIVSNDGNFEVRKSDPTTIPQALQLILGGANPQFIVNRWAEHRNQVSMGQTTVPTPFSEYAATNASPPRESVLSAYAKLDRTGQGYVRIPDLAREAGMTAAQIKPVLAAMNERGEIYLTPSDEPRDLTAEQRAFLIPNGISPAGLYVTKLAGLAANARPALNKLDLASASDESISYEPQQASPSALEFVLRDENSISREDRDALQWVEDNYGQRTIPVSAGGLSSLLRQGDSSKGGQSQASNAELVRRLGEQLYAAWQKRLLFIEGSKLPFDAVNPATSRNVIAVDRVALAPLLYLVGHELGHAMKAQHKRLYQPVASYVLANAADWSDFKKRLQGMNYEESFWNDEFTNDALGAVFTEPTFWRNLEQNHPSLTALASAALDSLSMMPVKKVYRVC